MIVGLFRLYFGISLVIFLGGCGVGRRPAMAESTRSSYEYFGVTKLSHFSYEYHRVDALFYVC